MKIRMKIRILSIILSLSFMVSLIGFSPAVSAKPSSWAAEEIAAAKELGLTTDRVTKDYQSDITREGFCEIVVKLYEKLSNSTALKGKDVFTDTDNPEILKAYRLGIVNGVSKDKFSPYSNITRQEICVMLTNCISKAIKGSKTDEYKNNRFEDESKISDWARAYVNYAYDKDIIKGVGGNKIDPLGNATCEQAILFVYRVYQARTTLTSDAEYIRKQRIADVQNDGYEVSTWNRKSVVYKDYENTYSSDFSYCLDADEPDDLRISKKFDVKRNKKYVISAYFKTEDIVVEEGGIYGANISSGDWQNSQVSLYGDNKWVYVSLIVESGDSTEIVGSFNLGYWSSLCTGKLYVDGITCKEVKIDVENTGVRHISNWASVSPLQQFKYMDEGLAYAYKSEGMLNIVTPSNNIEIPMEYPLLGDVISDDDGNFYVVWGRKNENDIYNIETIFISKYSDDGEHIETTGFVGESIMGVDGNTKSPFDFGNCDSAIGDGILMVNYGRSMYNGHQSNNVIGVRMRDMSPVEFDSVWERPYTSHSFNQRVIWSEHADDFVYADHGDAYDRGFIIACNGNQKNIFNFYLQANANYDMYIVNKTFAQLGGLVETSEGVVLVGASAKSISEKAKDEKQNLFIQIFDPNAARISSSMFVGGRKRSGETSFDINDNQNSELTPVTNYGVQWITNYTDRDVIAPHTVVADDKIVILWNEKKDNSIEAFYTVLASDGEILTPAKSLGKEQMLNSNEDPIYHDGYVQWAYPGDGEIKVKCIKV